MTTHTSVLCLLLILLALSFTVYAQTFQYSHGWKNGRKRAIDNALTSLDEDNKINSPFGRLLFDFVTKTGRNKFNRPNYLTNKEDSDNVNPGWPKWMEDVN